MIERLDLIKKANILTFSDTNKVRELFRKGLHLGGDEWRQYFADFRQNDVGLNWLCTLEDAFIHGWAHKERFPQTLTEIKGAFFGRKQLTSEMGAWLFDSQGNSIRRNGEVGRMDVSWYPPQRPTIYFKKNPEIPGYEYAATSFMRHLGVQGVPQSELVLFYHPSTNVSYPVLTSSAILGKRVDQVWHTDTVFQNLDETHTGLSILASMLLNFEDHKEDNIILSEDGQYLIPIDNDHAFIPGTVWEKGSIFTGWKIYEKLQAKSVFFSLPHMQKQIPDRVRESFLSHNPDHFLKDWLTKLEKIHDVYQNLPDEQGLATAYQNKEHPTIFRILLDPNYIKQVYEKFHKLQDYIQTHPEATYLEILKLVEPYVGKQYEAAFQDKSKKTVKERFIAVTHNLYTKASNSGQRLSINNSRDLMEVINLPEQDLIGATLEIKTKNDPSAAQHTLKSLIKQRQEDLAFKKRLLGGKGEINNPLDCSTIHPYSVGNESRRISQILSITTGTLAIHNSQTINYPLLTTPDIKDTIFQLKFLDLRGAKVLTEGSIKPIAQGMPQLLYLNISGWEKLQSVPEMTWPQLQRLVVNNCLHLKDIGLKAPKLRILEVAKNPLLKNLKPSIPNIEQLDVTGSPSVNILMIKPNKKVIKIIGRDSATLFQEGMDWHKKNQYKYSPCYFKLAADQGYAPAQYHLGLMYEQGRGVLKNEKEAVRLWRLAANQGHREAQYNLGRMYDLGRGVDKDEEEAVYLWGLAANQGYADAQYSLGRMYEQGRGVPKNEKVAVHLYTLAANQGHVEAQYNLGRIYEQGRGVPKNEKVAVRMWNLAANQGHVGAQYNLGRMYEQGRGVPKNEKEAIRWFILAADQGHADAQYKLGVRYKFGWGVTRNEEEAIRLWKLAANQGNVKAQNVLGLKSLNS